MLKDLGKTCWAGLLPYMESCLCLFNANRRLKTVNTVMVLFVHCDGECVEKYSVCKTGIQMHIEN